MFLLDSKMFLHSGYILIAIQNAGEINCVEITVKNYLSPLNEKK